MWQFCQCDLSFLKPACWSCNWSSTAAFILSKRILFRTLPGIDRSVIPLQLLQTLKSPLFGSLMRSPSFQSLGISSSSQMVSNSQRVKVTFNIIKSTLLRDPLRDPYIKIIIVIFKYPSQPHMERNNKTSTVTVW